MFCQLFSEQLFDQVRSRCYNEHKEAENKP